MRVLQLRKYGLLLDLHPFVTVVHGLPDEVRDQVIAALAAVPAGGDPGLAGLVEAHGILLDLTPAALRLLDLQSPLDVVVRASDLPGGRPNGNAAPKGPEPRIEEAAAVVAARRSALASAVVAVEAARDRLSAATGEPEETPHDPLDEWRERDQQARATKEALEAELATSTAVLTAAHAARAEAEAAVAARRDERRAAGEACSLAAGEVEAARTGRDPFASSALEAAREHLVDVTREVEAWEAAPEGEGEDEVVDVEERLETLRHRRVDVEASLLAVETGDRYAVESALADAKSAPHEMVVPPDALDLADRWDAVEAELARDGHTAGGDADTLVDARRRLEDARAELLDAEQAVRLPELDRGAIDELERAHEEVLDAHDKAHGRFGGQRAKKRLDDARVAEQVVLDRLGFTTYAEFVMGTSMLHIDPIAEQRLDAARQALADAEDEWSALEADLDAELTRAATLERRREIRDQARVILGVDIERDIGWALRQHRVLANSGDEQAERLRNALEHAGLRLADERLGLHELASLAEVWLAEEGDTSAHRPTLERELVDVESELANLEETQAPGADAVDIEHRNRARLDEARGAVVAAEARVARNEDAEAEVADRQAALEALIDAERAAAEAFAGAEAAAAAAVTAEHEATLAVDHAAAALVEATAAEREAAESLRSMESTLADAVAASAASEADVDELTRRVADAEATYQAAEHELTEAEHALAEVVATAADSPREPVDDGPEPVGPADVEEVEWYLLARLAAQRSVSYAGSVPLVLVDTLVALSDENVLRVLERLERMAASVQVVFITDHPVVANWATQVGADRAALVSVSG